MTRWTAAPSAGSWSCCIDMASSLSLENLGVSIAKLERVYEVWKLIIFSLPVTHGIEWREQISHYSRDIENREKILVKDTYLVYGLRASLGFAGRWLRASFVKSSTPFSISTYDLANSTRRSFSIGSFRRIAASSGLSDDVTWSRGQCCFHASSEGGQCLMIPGTLDLGQDSDNTHTIIRRLWTLNCCSSNSCVSRSMAVDR